jgi:hypothetical protein
MEEKKLEKLPIDAKLLSDAIIELNISRRSVGLYPSEHPIAKEAIKRAFELLKNLFELRSNITLGIAKDTLVIDEFTLDRKNPVFSEFALSLHDKGIAAITFFNGLDANELTSFDELITMHEGPTGKALLEYAEKKGLKHIRLSIIDLSSFSFVEGSFKAGALETKLWEDYMYGLLQGKLADTEADGVIFNINPEQIATILNSRMPEDAPDETYDSVISTYLRRKGQLSLSKEAFDRFMSFIHNLNPGLKSQFLKRALNTPPSETAEIEKTLAELKEDDIQKMIEVFKEGSFMIPESLMNILDKFKEVKADSKFVSSLTGEAGVLADDIEIDENIFRLLEDDSNIFVSERYKSELELMLKGIKAEESTATEALQNELNEKTIDSTISETMLELLESDYIDKEDYLVLLTRLSELANAFLETGRFHEICYLYNAFYSHSLSGRFKVEATSIVEHFFHSEQFISKLIYALKIWGRHDREGAVRLARGLKYYLITPMLDALSTENDPSIRKFFLYLLSTFGTDIVPEIERRLDDKRWYVVRNMIFLIRMCSTKRHKMDYLHKLRKLARDKNNKICTEAVKTLLEFGTRDAPSYLKLYLRSKNYDLRQQAVLLSGTYKVSDAVPYLIELLEKKDPFGTESYDKIQVVRSLAEIGDKRAIKALIKLYNSKALLYRGTLEELKVEIFRTLQNYPIDALKPILDLGINSKNEEIRSISKNLLTVSNSTGYA